MSDKTYEQPGQWDEPIEGHSTIANPVLSDTSKTRETLDTPARAEMKDKLYEREPASAPDTPQLPPLDVTQEERSTIKNMRPFATRCTLIALEHLKCRERQLSAALAEVARLKEEKNEQEAALKEIFQILLPVTNTADSTTTGMARKAVNMLAASQKKMDALIEAGRKVNRWYMHTTPEWNKDTQDAIDEFDAAIALAEERAK